jgi:hypothetical protein
MLVMPEGNSLVPVVLVGCIPVIFILFALLPGRRAALAGFLGGWMFLPNAGFQIQYFPEYNKAMATCVGIFAATLVFDMDRFRRFRPCWIDLFPLTLSIVPFFSSLSNGLGAYDGFSAMTGAFTSWMLPYLVGRLYFTDLKGMRELILGFFIAGLIYLPFCLWEMRMSPNLHYHVYGFNPSAFVQAYRGGGYRPVVFMRHGLMTVMFLGMSALCGFALWLSGAKKTFLNLPIALPIGALVLITLLCRSTGAQVLMLAGIGALLFMRYVRNPLPVVGLALFVVAYVVIRGGGLWDGQDLIRLADDAFGSERASSLETRIANENALSAKARQRILLGWGGWGRNRVKDDFGRDASITDGLWVIILGTNGAIGIAAFLGTMLVPALMLIGRVPPRFWMHPSAAAATAGALICCLWVADCIPNSMFNPIYMVTTGGLAAFRKVRVMQRQPARNVNRVNGAAPARRMEA